MKPTLYSLIIIAILNSYGIKITAQETPEQKNPLGEEQNSCAPDDPGKFSLGLTWKEIEKQISQTLKKEEQAKHERETFYLSMQIYYIRQESGFSEVLFKRKLNEIERIIAKMGDKNKFKEELVLASTLWLVRTFLDSPSEALREQIRQSSLLKIIEKMSASTSDVQTLFASSKSILLNLLNNRPIPVAQAIVISEKWSLRKRTLATQLNYLVGTFQLISDHNKQISLMVDEDIKKEIQKIYQESKLVSSTLLKIADTVLAKGKVESVQNKTVENLQETLTPGLVLRKFNAGNSGKNRDQVKSGPGNDQSKSSQKIKVKDIEQKVAEIEKVCQQLDACEKRKNKADENGRIESGTPIATDGSQSEYSQQRIKEAKKILKKAIDKFATREGQTKQSKLSNDVGILGAGVTVLARYSPPFNRIYYRKNLKPILGQNGAKVSDDQLDSTFLKRALSLDESKTDLVTVTNIFGDQRYIPTNGKFIRKKTEGSYVVSTSVDYPISVLQKQREKYLASKNYQTTAGSTFLDLPVPLQKELSRIFKIKDPQDRSMELKRLVHLLIKYDAMEDERAAVCDQVELGGKENIFTAFLAKLNLKFDNNRLSVIGNRPSSVCSTFADFFVFFQRLGEQHLLDQQKWVPSRVVVGYASSKGVVLSEDLHAWVELFYPEQGGWSIVEATPSGGRIDNYQKNAREFRKNLTGIETKKVRRDKVLPGLDAWDENAGSETNQNREESLEYEIEYNIDKLTWLELLESPELLKYVSALYQRFPTKIKTLLQRKQIGAIKDPLTFVKEFSTKVSLYFSGLFKNGDLISPLIKTCALKKPEEWKQWFAKNSMNNILEKNSETNAFEVIFQQVIDFITSQKNNAHCGWPLLELLVNYWDPDRTSFRKSDVKGLLIKLNHFASIKGINKAALVRAYKKILKELIQSIPRSYMDPLDMFLSQTSIAPSIFKLLSEEEKKELIKEHRLEFLLLDGVAALYSGESSELKDLAARTIASVINSLDDDQEPLVKMIKKRGLLSLLVLNNPNEISGSLLEQVQFEVAVPFVREGILKGKFSSLEKRYPKEFFKFAVNVAYSRNTNRRKTIGDDYLLKYFENKLDENSVETACKYSDLMLGELPKGTSLNDKDRLYSFTPDVEEWIPTKEIKRRFIKIIIYFAKNCPSAQKNLEKLFDFILNNSSIDWNTEMNFVDSLLKTADERSRAKLAAMMKEVVVKKYNEYQGILSNIKKDSLPYSLWGSGIVTLYKLIEWHRGQLDEGAFQSEILQTIEKLTSKQKIIYLSGILGAENKIIPNLLVSNKKVREKIYNILFGLAEIQVENINQASYSNRDPRFEKPVLPKLLLNRFLRATLKYGAKDEFLNALEKLNFKIEADVIEEVVPYLYKHSSSLSLSDLKLIIQKLKEKRKTDDSHEFFDLKLDQELSERLDFSCYFYRINPTAEDSQGTCGKHEDLLFFDLNAGLLFLKKQLEDKNLSLGGDVISSEQLIKLILLYVQNVGNQTRAGPFPLTLPPQLKKLITEITNLLFSFLGNESEETYRRFTSKWIIALAPIVNFDQLLKQHQEKIDTLLLGDKTWSSWLSIALKKEAKGPPLFISTGQTANSILWPLHFLELSKIQFDKHAIAKDQVHLYNFLRILTLKKNKEELFNLQPDLSSKIHPGWMQHYDQGLKELRSRIDYPALAKAIIQESPKNLQPYLVDIIKYMMKLLNELQSAASKQSKDTTKLREDLLVLTQAMHLLAENNQEIAQIYAPFAERIPFALFELDSKMVRPDRVELLSSEISRLNISVLKGEKVGFVNTRDSLNTILQKIDESDLKKRRVRERLGTLILDIVERTAPDDQVAALRSLKKMQVGKDRNIEREEWIIFLDEVFSYFGTKEEFKTSTEQLEQEAAVLLQKQGRKRFGILNTDFLPTVKMSDEIEVLFKSIDLVYRSPGVLEGEQHEVATKNFLQLLDMLDSRLLANPVAQNHFVSLLHSLISKIRPEKQHLFLKELWEKIGELKRPWNKKIGKGVYFKTVFSLLSSEDFEFTSNAKDFVLNLSSSELDDYGEEINGDISQIILALTGAAFDRMSTAYLYHERAQMRDRLIEFKIQLEEQLIDLTANGAERKERKLVDDKVQATEGLIFQGKGEGRFEKKENQKRHKMLIQVANRIEEIGPLAKAMKRQFTKGELRRKIGDFIFELVKLKKEQLKISMVRYDKGSLRHRRAAYQLSHLKNLSREVINRCFQKSSKSCQALFNFVPEIRQWKSILEQFENTSP